MPKDEQSMTQPAREIDLNILCKFIKKFDGNRENLNAFINNCRNAINLAATQQQDILLKYIISQLEGRAETACSIKEFETYQQLEDFLKSQFGERKHYAALLSDLQACHQLFNETVNQFALRIESCLSKLLTEINISIPTKKKAELAGRVAAMQDLALHTFILGLSPRLSTVVRCRDPETLNDAINSALSEEKIIQSTLRKTPNTSFSQNQWRPNRQSPNFNHNRSFTQRGTNFTNQINHENVMPSTSRYNPPVCRYCQIPGHTIERCRKREYNNRRFNNNQNNFNQNNRPSPNFNFQSRNQPIHVVNSEEQGTDETDNHLNGQDFPSGTVREI